MISQTSKSTQSKCLTILQNTQHISSPMTDDTVQQKSCDIIQTS